MTPGTCVRIWLLVPVLLTTACATSVQQAEEERGSLLAHSTDAGGNVFAFGGESVQQAEEERGSLPAHSTDAGGNVFAFGGGSVGKSDRQRGPKPRYKVAADCVESAVQRISIPLIALLSFAVCANKTAPQSAMVAVSANETPRQSAGLGGGYDRPGLRKLTKEEASVFPTGYFNNCYRDKC